MGYRTAGWNGTLNIPGFVFDQAEVTDWEAFKDYAIGDTVRYKEFYYSAKNKIAGGRDFVRAEWNRILRKAWNKIIYKL